MKLADMREKITISKATVVVDSYGNRTNTYQDVCTRWTYANKTSGDEFFEGGKTNEKEHISFVIRYDSVTKLITPGKYRIAFHGKIYNVVSVDNYKYRNNTLTLYGEEIDD